MFDSGVMLKSNLKKIYILHYFDSFYSIFIAFWIISINFFNKCLVAITNTTTNNFAHNKVLFKVCVRKEHAWHEM